MKTIAHHRSKMLLLVWMFVMACGAFISWAQSPLSLLVDFNAGSQMRLSWTNTSGSVVLEETDTIAPTSDWGPFAQSPTLANGEFSVLVDITGLSRFFRLRQEQRNDSPPDLTSVAPSLPNGVTTSLTEATEFLYKGPNPIQTGVTEGTIKTKRAAVLRGSVKQRDNSPLSGVSISILSHPELGQTLTRTNGMFDMVVNGGGFLTVQYAKTGFCPVQRQISVSWGDYARVPDAIMIQMDPIVTPITLGANSALQVHQASMQTDADGARHATLLFTPGTCANIVLPNGTIQPCGSMSVRATEFTVGPSGPKAMPAALPPTSAYTYCVELSADEAMAQGATTVQFDRPVFTYVENFLGFPVGMDVPLGSYDHDRGVWIPEKNGKVIKILSATAGVADVDTDGDDQADSAAALAALSITDAERQQLATLYKPGQSLWRLAVTHFTPYDANMPMVPPPDAVLPSDDPEPDESLDNCCELAGNSVIETQDQILGEEIHVVGTGFGLHYRSDRQPGYKAAYTLDIPLSGASLPASVQSIELEIDVAGRQFGQSFPAAPNQRTTFTWDGKDAYGRTIDGPQPISVKTSYTYQGVYSRTAKFGAPPNGVITVVRAREQVKLTRLTPMFIGSFHHTSAGLGGWTLSPHHAYDPKTMVLLRGDGRRESASAKEAAGPIITRFAGTGSQNGFGFSGDGGPALKAEVNPQGIAFGPDGSLYIACPDNNRVRQVAPDGTITTVAGNGTRCDSSAAPCGDGGLATKAQLNAPTAVAVGPDNSFYIADTGNARIRKVDTNGVITTIAGNGTSGFSGDNGPGPLAQLCNPLSLAVGPDSAVYIAGCRRVRRIGPDGIITTVAGNADGVCYSLPDVTCGDGRLATEVDIDPTSVAVDSDGILYIGGRGAVRRVTADGIIQTIVGGKYAPGEVESRLEDGVPAAKAAIAPNSLALGPGGTIFWTDQTGGYRLRWVRPGGLVDTLAGPRFFTGIPNGDGGPARRAFIDSLGQGNYLAVGPDGSVYLAEYYARQIRRIAPTEENFVAGELVVPARDGSEVFIFTPGGRHLRTVNGLTGALRYQFAYDAAGQLATITDGSGSVTTIERDGNGAATGILGPFGQRTTLELDAEGYLSKVNNPAGEDVRLSYGSGGLLAAFTKPGGQKSSYAYEPIGRLASATDPTGATKILARSGSNKDHTVTVTTALGRVSTFQVARDTNRVLRLTTTDPAGVQSILAITQDGTRSTTSSDGTITTVAFGPDPRWGMRVPIPTNVTVKTPGGLTNLTTMQRTVTLTSPGALLNLSALTDTVTNNGRAFRTEYNASTRTLTYTLPTGLQQKTVFDDKGRAVQGQLGTLESGSVAYDDHGRLASVTAGTGGNSRMTSFTYASNGFLRGVTDALGRTLTLTNDAVGRVTDILRPSGTTVGINYDANGRISRVTPPGRPSHLFTHTARDEVSSYTAPVVEAENSQATLTYDADRKPTQVKRPSGDTNSWQYDSAGRLSHHTLQGGDRTYAYDAANRLVLLATSAGINLTRTYDGGISTGTAWSGAVTGTVTQTYNSDFRLSEMRVNGADPISVQYDKDGVPTQIGRLVLTRDTQTGLVTATALDALSDAVTYDGFGEMIAYSASHKSVALYSATYGRDQLGRITNKSETINGTSQAFIYAYDPDGQLTEVQQNNVLSAKYAYDPNGSRIGFTGATGTISASYDVQDRLTQYGATTYSYSPNGELLRKTTRTQITTYDYDGASKLTGLTLPDATRIEYLLDALGRRIGRKVNGVLVQAFLYQDRLRPIAELDGAGGVVARFVYGGGTTPSYMIKGGTTYRIITDQIGSPRLVIDVASGHIAQRMDYDEFGLVTLDTNPGFQPFGFAGGLYDRLSGLVHFGAREYDPESGRWTRKDATGFLGGSNVYAYANSNPVNLVDPTGNTPAPPTFPWNPGSPFGTGGTYGPANPGPSGPAIEPMTPATPAPTAEPVPPPAPAPLRSPAPFELPRPGQPLFGSPPEYVLPPGGGTSIPEAAPPCGGLRLTAPVATFALVALATGVTIGTWINREFDLSGKASDGGIFLRDSLEEAGVPDQDAEILGGLYAIGNSIAVLRIPGFGI